MHRHQDLYKTGTGVNDLVNLVQRRVATRMSTKGWGAELRCVLRALQTVFLPVIGLVEADQLKPGDLVCKCLYFRLLLQYSVCLGLLVLRCERRLW